jgi:hypothetical protein
MKFSSVAMSLAVSLAAWFAPANNAQSADLPGAVQLEHTTEAGVSIAVSPFYMWLPGMNGTIGVLGTTVDVDLTPIDIIENLGDFLDALDGLYMGTGELRYREFGLMYDVFYLDVSSSREIDRAVISGTLDAGFSQTMVTLAATYRFWETEHGYLDALAGARIWDINMDVGANLNIAALTASDGDSWVDPIVGAKARYNISPNTYLNGWAMIGGFGAGSDFTWDVWTNVGYQWNNWLDLYAGFRAAGADYQNGTFIWDVTQYGPVFGATIKLN